MQTKYRPLIVEDDPLVVEQLVGFLDQTNLFEKPYVCRSATEAISALNSQPFDLLFLDIELPDMSGLDLLTIYPQHPPVSAISTHPRYAIDCYDIDVDDFMLKPLTYSRFFRSVSRTLLKPQHAQEPHYATGLTQHTLPQTAPLPANHIYLKTGRKVERFIVDDILYMEAFHIYTKLITNSGSFIINEKLSTLEQRLQSNNFMRIHKSYLVSLKQVTQFKANAIWLGKLKVPIGVTFKTKAQERLKALGIL